MPGVCGIQSIASHHLAWLRNPHTHGGITQGNLFYEEANEIARMIGLKYKIDFLLNFRGEVIQVFSGDVVEEHAEASKRCLQITAADIPRKVDVDHFRGLSPGEREPVDQGPHDGGFQ